VLEIAILGLLKEQDLHGYELRKRLGELGPASRVSFGSLYPALNRLQRGGLVESLGRGEVGRGEEGRAPASPATGSMAGEAAAFRAGRRGGGRGSGRSGRARSSRVRKVYRITPRGEDHFRDHLTRSPAGGDDERSFGLRLVFCRYLDPVDRLALLERRRAQLAARLAAARATSGRQRSRMDPYTRSLVEHDTESVARDVSWLDDLIASERARGPLETTRPPAPTASPSGAQGTD